MQKSLRGDNKFFLKKKKNDYLDRRRPLAVGTLLYALALAMPYVPSIYTEKSER